jgi:hypothetical protein
MAKSQRLKRQMQRGMKCSYCGKLKYFYDREIAVMNSTAGRREQCQHCGHTHWDECPQSKRVKEIKTLDKMPTRRSDSGVEFI